MSDRPVQVHLSLAEPAYAAHARIGPHALQADEPTDLGGMDTGPTPNEILLQALGACTAITLRMYAERKQWPLTGVSVTLDYAEREKTHSRITLALTLEGPLDAEQRQRLEQIAHACPVHRTLTGAVSIDVALA